ncbi:MAG: lysozyme inhibitor LprI family protein [Thainema sp.]
MNICAHQSYEAVDVELNQTYQALTQELNAPEQELLTDAELAWIEYRDNTCELEAAPYEGGTIQPLIYSQCLTRMTENRTAELQAHLDEINSR